jgi:hypothetical protein
MQHFFRSYKRVIGMYRSFIHLFPQTDRKQLSSSVSHVQGGPHTQVRMQPVPKARRDLLSWLAQASLRSPQRPSGLHQPPGRSQRLATRQGTSRGAGLACRGFLQARVARR